MPYSVSRSIIIFHTPTTFKFEIPIGDRRFLMIFFVWHLIELSFYFIPAQCTQPFAHRSSIKYVNYFTHLFENEIHHFPCKFWKQKFRFHDLNFRCVFFQHYLLHQENSTRDYILSVSCNNQNVRCSIEERTKMPDIQE